LDLGFPGKSSGGNVGHAFSPVLLGIDPNGIIRRGTKQKCRQVTEKTYSRVANQVAHDKGRYHSDQSRPQNTDAIDLSILGELTD
jgi:hypothetical protein